MDGLEPLMDRDDLPDVFINGRAMRITAAPAYFRLKHLEAWCALCGGPGRKRPIRLRPGEDWDSLADRLSERWQVYLWHPSHWDSYYATLPDIPASVLAAREWIQPAGPLPADTGEGQYKLFLDNN